jgi:hypothetical protein
MTLHWLFSWRVLLMSSLTLFALLAVEMSQPVVQVVIVTYAPQQVALRPDVSQPVGLGADAEVCDVVEVVQPSSQTLVPVTPWVTKRLVLVLAVWLALVAVTVMAKSHIVGGPGL